MKYQVLFTEQARRDLIETCDWWSENRSAEQAERWYDGITAAIVSLASITLGDEL